MPRSSPQTVRLVEIIELLRARRQRGGSASDIARHLGVDRATCYPMLRELCFYGWLFREPYTKRFHLGPSLVAVGSTAQSSMDVVDAARPVMAELADDTDMACVLVCRSGDSLIVAEISHPYGEHRPTLGLEVGDTYGFRAPLGAVIAAWDGAAAADAWAEHDNSTAEFTRAALRTIRRRGFAVEALRHPRNLEREVDTARSVALSRRAAQATIERIAAGFPADMLLDEIATCASMQVLTVSAPVFSAGGPVAALCLFDPPALNADDVARLGRRLADGAACVTAELTHEPVLALG